jgi:hypothetical protein
MPINLEKAADARCFTDLVAALRSMGRKEFPIANRRGDIRYCVRA